MFPETGVPQNGWFIMENLIKIDDLGENPLFSETPKWMVGSYDCFLWGPAYFQGPLPAHLEKLLD